MQTIEERAFQAALNDDHEELKRLIASLTEAERKDLLATLDRMIMAVQGDLI